MVWTLEAHHRAIAGPMSHERLLSYLPLADVAERYLSHWGGIFRGDLTYLCPDPAMQPLALAEAHPTLFVGVPRVWEKFQTAILAGLAAEPDAGRHAAVEGAIDASRKLVALQQAGQEPPPELTASVERAQPVFAALHGRLGLDQCHLAGTSTAPLPRDVMEFFAAVGLPLFEVWGISELTGPATAVPLDGFRIGSVGIALPGVEVRLADDGEILVRGGNLTPGYYREPERTAEAIDRDGWMHTGEVRTVDDNGYFKVVDRTPSLSSAPQAESPSVGLLPSGAQASARGCSAEVASLWVRTRQIPRIPRRRRRRECGYGGCPGCVTEASARPPGRKLRDRVAGDGYRRYMTSTRNRLSVREGTAPLPALREGVPGLSNRRCAAGSGRRRAWTRRWRSTRSSAWTWCCPTPTGSATRRSSRSAGPSRPR